MKVLVLNNAAPFLRGGAEELADELVRRLNGVKGVSAELMRIPFAWEPADRLVDEILIHRRLKLINVDKVIALKFPAYLVPHHHKVLWVLHQFRQAYDLYDAGQSHLTGPDGAAIREAITRADNTCFDESRAVFVNSPVTQKRMAHYNQRKSEVLYPPLNDAELFTGGEAGDYIFAGGRVGPGKRQHLLVEAMAKLPGSGRLIIAGPAQSEDYAAELRRLIAAHDLGGRVELHLDFHSRARIAGWVNGALACACLPFDEDSLSYVAMEAFAAGKPVLTVTDSGGVLEIVTEATGRVSSPDPDDLAAGLSFIFADRSRAETLGKAAKERLDAMRLGWTATLDRLLGA